MSSIPPPTEMSVAAPTGPVPVRRPGAGRAVAVVVLVAAAALIPLFGPRAALD
ncbi:hypothetical protein G3I40_30385, partial [Streptomyces sp. SID14478]|nr:hypothetical protein [Streptomyces sp. SID14478]